MRQKLRYRRVLVAMAFLFAVSIFEAFSLEDPLSDLPPNHSRNTILGTAFQLKQFQVNTGNEALAKQYYQDTVSKHLQFRTPETILDSSIGDLLAYFGYDQISADKLHSLPSDELMKLSDPGAILAARFFAPKITDVADKPTEIPEGGFGWRKLIRFVARDDSPAAQNGMEMLYFLQNIFETTVASDPFNISKNFSKFNQAIVVRKEGPFSAVKQPLYFFTYGPLIKLNPDGTIKTDANKNLESDGKLSFSLKATFNEDDREPETNLKPKEYFVPDSCIECHGNVRARTKVNFLDTDHWFDRVFPQYGISDSNDRYKKEDFTSLAASPFGVIYDGGKDQGSNQFQQAFEVFRKLNEEIHDQNLRVSGPTSFQVLAVQQWLNVHGIQRFGSSHVPPYERGFGNNPWSPNSQEHRKLLYYFNRYCYRCHSSVRYNVYQREDVIRLAIRDRVLSIDTASPDFWMPQDRVFPGLRVDSTTGEPTPVDDLKEFLDLLEKQN